MKAFNFVLITLAFYHKAIADKDFCIKPNEEYTRCGTACPATCDNLSNPPTFCTKQCVIGCACKSGYVKNRAGECVLPCECPKITVPRCSRKFEIYNSCGSACPLTCDNYHNPPGCTKQCVPGCYCQEGYVRNQANGNCVLPSQCPKNTRCFRRHETYYECGTACPLTCKNYKNPPSVCITLCVAECQCNPGYVRNEDDGNCYLPSQCPGSQGKCLQNHETYTNCGSACPLTCENYKDKNRVCTLQCVPGCFCDKGYVRNRKGACVTPSQC